MNMFGNKLVTWTSCTTGFLTLGLKPANHSPSHPHGVPHLYTSRLLLRFPFSIVPPRDMMQTVRNPAGWPKAPDAAPEPATQWANFDQDSYPSHCEAGVAECHVSGQIEQP